VIRAIITALGPNPGPINLNKKNPKDSYKVSVKSEIYWVLFYFDTKSLCEMIDILLLMLVLLQ
jgi:hypothetical protein